MKKIKRYIKYLFNYRKNNGISFKESLALAELPIISVKCKDVSGSEYKVNLLLDTGADFNIINESFLKTNNISLQVVGHTTGLTTASGVDNETTVDIVSIDLVINDTVINSEFSVRNVDSVFNQVKSESGIQLHGILSSGFFNEHKYILDYECGKIY